MALKTTTQKMFVVRPKGLDGEATKVPRKEVEEAHGDEMLGAEISRLSEEIGRTIEVTRRLVVGINGQGSQGLAALLSGIKEQGMKFGEPYAEKKGEKFVNGRAVDAVLLYSTGENGEILDATETDVLSKELRDSGAIEVKNGDEAVDKIRSLVNDWKLLGKPRIAETIHVDVIASRAGQTGQAGAKIISDTLSAIRKAFGDTHSVIARLFSVPELPPKSPYSNKDRAKKAVDTLIQALNFALLMQKSVIKLDGEEVSASRPNRIYFIGDQSLEMRLPTGGERHFAHIPVKLILSEMKADGALADDKKILPSTGPLSALGVCEAVPEPSREFLEHKKKRNLFSSAVGLNAVNTDHASKIGRYAGVFFNDALVDDWTEMVKPLSIDPSEEDRIFELKKKKKSAEVHDYLSALCSTLEGQIGTREAAINKYIERELGKIVEYIQNYSEQLLREDGLTVEGSFLDTLIHKVDLFCDFCEEQIGELEQDNKDFKRAVDSKMEEIFAVNLHSWSRESTGENLKTLIHELINELNDLSENRNDLTFYEQLRGVHLARVREALEDLKTKNVDRFKRAFLYFNSISARPEAARTPIDLPIHIPELWGASDGSELRRQYLSDYSAEEFVALEKSIQMDTRESSLLPLITEDMAEELARASTPFFRPSSSFKIREKILKRVAVPSGNIEAKVPHGFGVVQARIKDGMVAIQQLHNVGLLDIEDVVEGYEEFVQMTPQERQELFSMEDIDLILKFSEEVVGKKIGSSKIQKCMGCNIAFVPNLEKNPCCVGCSKVIGS